MKGRTTKAIALCSIIAAIGTLGCADHSFAQTVSIKDRADVYDAVLASWFDKAARHQLVDQHLGQHPSKADAKECTAKLDLVTGDDRQHIQSLADIPLRTKGIELVDGSKWIAADPSDAIANGEKVESAVRKGFSHSLISFSQISFSRDGMDALVNMGMTCGRLCGSGSTIHLHKRSMGWAVIDRCGNWLS